MKVFKQIDLRLLTFMCYKLASLRATFFSAISDPKFHGSCVRSLAYWCYHANGYSCELSERKYSRIVF